MKNQAIELKSRVIADHEATQDQLLQESSKHILHKPGNLIKVSGLKKRPKNIRNKV